MSKKCDTYCCHLARESCGIDAEIGPHILNRAKYKLNRQESNLEVDSATHIYLYYHCNIFILFNFLSVVFKLPKV